ncbi:MAG TPA: hypothetical protein VLZ81_04665, partial [Blastocatellia bacterium]|nr:hypothetical protein [Blastocatellia bacterium]
MRRAFICSVLTFLALFLASDCRAQSQRPEPESQDRNTVVRLSVTLIQVDAVVSDAQGRQLTDLAPGEFEVTVRGRRQHVTTASYRVGDGTTTAQGAAVGSTSNSNAAPAQPPAQVQQASGQLGMGHRATMFVVDDLLS